MTEPTGARRTQSAFIDVITANDWLAIEPRGIPTLAVTSVPAVTASELGFPMRSEQHGPWLRTISTSRPGSGAPAVGMAVMVMTPQVRVED
jgi:hypothetical protein